MGAVVTMFNRRGRQLTRDGRERFLMYPQMAEHGKRHLYALGLSDGRTKIGVCVHPRSRFIQHWVANDGRVTWTHLFHAMEGSAAFRVERDACARAALLGERIRRTEQFRGLDRDTTIRCVRQAIAKAA